MTRFHQLTLWLLLATLWTCVTTAAAAPRAPKASGDAAARSFSFDGTNYFHRWSRDGRNEFTPRGQEDLLVWKDMVTVIVYKNVTNGDELATVAKNVVDLYEANGKVLLTDSRPRTEKRPAEHLVVAVLGDPAYLEAAFARLLLQGDTGMAVVYSHRIYGNNVGQAMSEWVQANGPGKSDALMRWDKVPTAADLKNLPQNL